MGTPAHPLPYAEAIAVVTHHAEALRDRKQATEMLPLLEAQGRILAEPLTADRNQPPFARSTRDGFAARAEDLARGPVRVRGLLRAGEAWGGQPLEAGQCIEIMTGAPVPPGTDCVVMIEHIERTGGFIALAPDRLMTAGNNIVPAGAEARAGQVLLHAGTRFSAHGTAAAAACGYAQVPVYRRPRVTILSTGDELVEVNETPLPHQIRNSNSLTLAALVQRLGGEAVLAPPVADERTALDTALRTATAQSDLLLVSGGVSMGQYDLVEPALAALGGSFHFTGARIQPGKPVVFGSLQGLPFFGLPGNPVSTIVCFSLFVAPLLSVLAGESTYTPPFVRATLSTPVQAKHGLTRFLPAILRASLAEAVVSPVAWQGSGDLASTARANCFLVVPEEERELVAGSSVTVLLA